MRYLLILLLTIPFATFASEVIDLAPLPMPREFKCDIDSPVAFDASSVVELDCQDSVAREWVESRFKEWYGKYAPKVKLISTQESALLQDEGYAVVANSAGIKIAAKTLAGVRWAAYTLRQLVIAKRGTFNTEGYILPTLKIADYPHLKFRAVHLCWFPEIRKEQIERAIRLAALMKFNYVIIEPWGMYKSKKHPWWGWPEAKMTQTEIRRLVDVARDHGVTLIPQIAAFGHAGASRSRTLKHSVLDLHPEFEPLFEPGGWNWCLTNPETQRVLRELIVELLEDFGNPPYIHLGCDEAQPPSCPECRKRPYGKIVCEHITALSEFVSSKGAKAMIWHDMLLEQRNPKWRSFVAMGSKETAKLVDTLSKDVIICDWQYSYGNMNEVRKEWPTIRYFHEKGFSVAACPWRNYNSMDAMAKFVANIGSFGYIQTTWHHLRGKEWAKMYRFGSSAAWGTAVRGKLVHGATPQFDTEFANLLRMVGHDMKVTDYRDTGHVDYQLPPAWWVDN